MKKLILLIFLLGLFLGGFGQRSLNQFSAASTLADGDKIFVWQSGSKSRTFSGLQSDILENDVIQTVMIADDQVTTDKIADDAVTLAKLADNSVSTFQIIDDNITTAKINAGAVGTTELAADAVTEAIIADDAVEKEHLKDGESTKCMADSDGTDLVQDTGGSVDDQIGAFDFRLNMLDTDGDGFYLAAYFTANLQEAGLAKIKLYDSDDDDLQYGWTSDPLEDTEAVLVEIWGHRVNSYEIEMIVRETYTAQGVWNEDVGLTNGLKITLITTADNFADLGVTQPYFRFYGNSATANNIKLRFYKCENIKKVNAEYTIP